MITQKRKRNVSRIEPILIENKIAHSQFTLSVSVKKKLQVRQISFFLNFCSSRLFIGTKTVKNRIFKTFLHNHWNACRCLFCKQNEK